MTNLTQKVQKNINDLIKSVSTSTGMILTYPLLVEFFDGDHNAAIFMNQVLYWTDRTKDPDGWFYKTYDEWAAELQFSYYQVQRVIYGDERVQNPKRNLSDVGLETQVKMAPNGRNATFYRLEVAEFVGIFVEWIEEKFGALVGQVRNMFRHKTADESQKQPESMLTVIEEIWQPLTIESQPEIVPTKRVAQPWHTSFGKDKTIADVWEIAHHQLEIQFDRASYDIYLKHITLVDYDAETVMFTLAVRDTHNLNRVQHRLHRNIRRVLSDVFGQEVTITYVSYDNWRERSQ